MSQGGSCSPHSFDSFCSASPADSEFSRLRLQLSSADIYKLHSIPPNFLSQCDFQAFDESLPEDATPPLFHYVQAGRVAEEDESIACISFVKDAKQDLKLHTEDEDFAVCVGRRIVLIGLTKNVSDFSFIPKGVFLDDSPTEKFHSLCFLCTNSGLSIAAGGRDGILKLFSLSDLAKTCGIIGHRSAIRAIRGMDDGDFVVTCGDDLSTRLWNVQARVQIAIFQGVLAHSDSVRCLDVHHSQKFIVTGSLDRCVQIWSLSEQIRSGQTQSQSFPASPVSPVPGSVRFPTQLITHPLFFSYKIHSKGVTAVQFYHDLVVSQDESSTVCVWSANMTRGDGAVILLHKVQGRAGRFGLDAERGLLASAGDAGEVWLWNLTDLHTRKEVASVPDQVVIRGCAFARDGTVLLAYTKDSHVLKLQRFG